MKFVQISFYSALFLVLSACGSNETPTTKDVPKKEKRIVKIEVSRYQKETTYLVDYSQSGIITVSQHPSDKNVEFRLELNDHNQVTEVISGSQRIQSLFNGKHERIGVIDSRQSHTIYTHENGKIIAEYRTLNNDTLVSYHYNYTDGFPSEVTVSGLQGYYRKYALTYSKQKNNLSKNFDQLFLPDVTSILGTPAVFAENYLESAVRIDPLADENTGLTESFAPSFNEITFKITSSGNQESINLEVDQRPYWNAKLFWE